MNREKAVVPEGAGWRDIPRGGVIRHAGNAEYYETGDWRSSRPIWDQDKCTSCLRCWIVCPDSAIVVKDGKMTGINYTHCKGCGICEYECPKKVQAIKMVSESDLGNGEGA